MLEFASCFIYCIKIVFSPEIGALGPMDNSALPVVFQVPVQVQNKPFE